MTDATAPIRTWSPQPGRKPLPPPPRSRHRLAVEEVLRAIGRAGALSAAELAERTGHPPAAVRSALNGLVQRGHVRNVNPHQLPARYCWNARTARATSAARAEPARLFPRELYDGKELRPYEGRPGAMRAFELPSLVNGVPVPRPRPALITARGDQR